MLLTFSMRRVDVGRLLLSAWQKVTLQRRHCLSKDWPYLRAATQVCDCGLRVDIGRWCDVGVGGSCVGRKDAPVEALEMNADALRRID